jgi:hypothetical protein
VCCVKQVKVEKKGRETVEERAKVREEMVVATEAEIASLLNLFLPIRASTINYKQSPLLDSDGLSYSSRQARPIPDSLSALRSPDKISCAYDSASLSAWRSLAKPHLLSEPAIHGFDSLIATANKLVKVAKVQCGVFWPHWRI